MLKLERKYLNDAGVVGVLLLHLCGEVATRLAQRSAPQQSVIRPVGNKLVGNARARFPWWHSATFLMMCESITLQGPRLPELTSGSIMAGSDICKGSGGVGA